ncbi:phosphorylcholine metabolism protein LicD [Methanobrevibacter gottschalkii DSM 11977]|uniref:Phosphorylcholine metabolism protein LicD n=2 Tax=Methanobacteriaceae TaxID=2159 RepID=A0A3N5B941_9EURY|nr:phosphorylcholine metabolism protein LicD [Methanobrevibacter gottschalkii DSM 11977]
MSNMNSIQKNLFQLLVEFDEICKKYDIKYLLAAGASLGAVRNHRFMPWDDDIDLYITRENWNKLRHILETEKDVLPNGRSFVYKENTPYYSNPLPRYINDTTTTMYRNQALAGKACGQHLEIFIFDPIPRGEKEKQKYLDLLHVYTELLSPYFIVNKHATYEDWEKHYKLYKKYCDRIDKEGEEKVLNELENTLQQYSIEDCDEYCMCWGTKDYIYDKELFQEGQMGLFEGKEFPIGKHPEGILRIAYGDSWMYIPEIDEQIVHGGIKYDNISFKEYTDKYLHKINRDSAFEKFKINKRNNVDLYNVREKVRMLIAKEKVQVGCMHFKNNLKENEELLRSLLENGDYLELSERFEEYSILQSMNEVQKFKIFVPITDKNLATFLLNLLKQGKYYQINKYLNIRKLNESPLTKELITIENEVEFCRKLSIARYDNKDEELVQSIIDKYDGIFSDLLDIYRAKLWIKEINAKSSKDYKDINNLCNEILKKYPFDGETMAIQAKAKSELGQENESLELYKKSILNTRNGLIWQKVEDESGISRMEMERELIEEEN